MPNNTHLVLYSSNFHAYRKCVHNTQNAHTTHCIDCVEKIGFAPCAAHLMFSNYCLISRLIKTLSASAVPA